MTRPTLPQMPGRGSAGGGWTQPLSELWTQLLAEMRGLQERLDGAGLHGVPASYGGQRTFVAEDATVTVVDPINLDTETTNYVVRDGQTYDIPIYFSGPGVFVARRLEVSVFQLIGQDLRLARTLTTELSIESNIADITTADLNIRTNRWSLNDVWWAPVLLGFIDWSPAVNYFWNFSDLKSKRYLADDLISHLALLPMTPSIAPTLDGAVDTPVPVFTPVDGATFEFDAPWLFERDGQAMFHFRPITAMYGSSAQPVTVQVELHGERYENLQDAMRSGAMTRPVRRDER